MSLIKPRREVDKYTSKKVLVTLLDEGTASSKDLRKILKKGPGPIESSVYMLRGQGKVDSAGYGKWTLTEKGKQEALEFAPTYNDLLFGNTTKEEIKSIPSPKVTHNYEYPINKEPKVLEEKQEQKLETEVIDWAQEYIKLSNKLADALINQINHA